MLVIINGNLFKLHLGLEVSKPVFINPNASTFFEKIKKDFVVNPFYDGYQDDFGKFTEAICAFNYYGLLSGKEITSKFEI